MVTSTTALAAIEVARAMMASSRWSGARGVSSPASPGFAGAPALDVHGVATGHTEVNL